MSKRTGKKREAPISYRPPAELRAEFAARVEKSGLSTSAFITQAVFSQEAPRQSRRPPVEQKMLAQLLFQAAQIRDQLHEISTTDTDANQTDLIERAVDELAELRAAILKVMGRKP
ncbi:MAG: hypothetical protein AB2809_20580 [Candidatus Thiodiazotropha sp.]